MTTPIVVYYDTTKHGQTLCIFCVYVYIFCVLYICMCVCVQIEYILFIGVPHVYTTNKRKKTIKTKQNKIIYKHIYKT